MTHESEYSASATCANVAYRVLSVDVHIAEMHDLHRLASPGPPHPIDIRLILREGYVPWHQRRERAHSKHGIAELGRGIPKQGEVSEVVRENGSLRAERALADVVILDLAERRVSPGQRGAVRIRARRGYAP